MEASFGCGKVLGVSGLQVGWSSCGSGTLVSVNKFQQHTGGDHFCLTVVTELICCERPCGLGIPH